MKTSGNIFDIAATFSLTVFSGAIGCMYLSPGSELLLLDDNADAPPGCAYVCKFPQSRELIASRLSYLHRVPRPARDEPDAIRA